MQLTLGIVTGNPGVLGAYLYLYLPLPYLQTHGFSHQKPAKTTKK